MRGLAFLASGGVGFGAAFLALVGAAPTIAAQPGGTTYHFICYSQHTDAGVAYASEVITETVADNQAYAVRVNELTRRFYEHLTKIGQWQNNSWQPCRGYLVENMSWDNQLREAFGRKQIGARYDTIGGDWIRVVRADLPRGWQDMPAPSEVQDGMAEAEKPTDSQKATKGEEEKPIETAADAEKERIAAREKREAEWQAKVDTYAAEKAAWEAKIAAQKRAEERQRVQHAAAQAEAAKVKAAHEAKMAAHRRELDEANRRQQEYFAAQRRYALCVGGDRKWCEPADATVTKTADAGDASTDTDATTCVSRPVISGNATFEGNTAATVVNGCETAVDVRICLRREGGWNCGMTSGLQPQDRWSHSSFKSTGEIFWDARVAGSNKALGSPGGN